MKRFLAFASLCSIGAHSTVLGQDSGAPLSPINSAILEMCPSLVSGEVAASSVTGEFGFDQPKPEEETWVSGSTNEVVSVTYEPAERRCDVSYKASRILMLLTGLSHEEAMVEHGGYKLLELDNPTPTAGSVYIRFNRDKSRREQYTFVYGDELLTISFTEKANF